MKKMFLLGLLLGFSGTLAVAHAAAPRLAVAVAPAPVLNTPDFAEVFSGRIKLDPCKGVRPIEFIALPGTLFTIEGEQMKGGIKVYRVTSNDYPYRNKTGYFVDARFLKAVTGPANERPRSLPEQSVVQHRLRDALGKPYVWGGNVKEGVPLLKELYPEADALAGVDCSGLLYEATDGFTPRNTSALTSFGSAVAIEGLTADKIAQKLEPLDLVVWKGHVMIVLDRDTIIQSTMGCEGPGGVHASELRETLRRLMKGKKPVDDPKRAAGAKAFVVRRWFQR